MIVKTNEVVGKNLWDEVWEHGVYWTFNGNPLDQSNYSGFRAKNYISIVPNKQYYLQYPYGFALGVVLVYYDKNRNAILQERLYTSVFIVPNDERIKYLRFSSSDDSRSEITEYLYDVSLFKYTSGMDTSYEPFKGYKSYMTANNTKLMEEMN